MAEGLEGFLAERRPVAWTLVSAMAGRPRDAPASAASWPKTVILMAAPPLSGCHLCQGSPRWAIQQKIVTEGGIGIFPAVAQDAGECQMRPFGAALRESEDCGDEVGRTRFPTGEAGRDVVQTAQPD